LQREEIENSLTNGRGLDEREEDRRRILREYPHMPKETLEFVLSLPIE